MSLEGNFEAKVRQAALDRAEVELGGENGLAAEAIEESIRQLEAYSDQYDVDPIIESLEGPTLDRDGDEISVSWRWTHEAAEFFEYGTSAHTIEGDPVLSFIWEDPPQWVREEFDQGRSEGGQFRSGWRVFFPDIEVDGIEETRFAREGLAYLRHELASF